MPRLTAILHIVVYENDCHRVPTSHVWGKLWRVVGKQTKPAFSSICFIFFFGPTPQPNTFTITGRFSSLRQLYAWITGQGIAEEHNRVQRVSFREGYHWEISKVSFQNDLKSTPRNHVPCGFLLNVQRAWSTRCSVILSAFLAPMVLFHRDVLRFLIGKANEETLPTRYVLPAVMWTFRGCQRENFMKSSTGQLEAEPSNRIATPSAEARRRLVFPFKLVCG